MNIEEQPNGWLRRQSSKAQTMPKRLTLEQKVRGFVQVSALTKVTKEDVASYFKVAPSSISRIFDKLISEGIIAKPEKIILEIYPILPVNDNSLSFARPVGRSHDNGVKNVQASKKR